MAAHGDRQHVLVQDAFDWAVELNPTSNTLRRLKDDLNLPANKTIGSQPLQVEDEVPDRAIDYFLKGERLRQKAFDNSTSLRLESDNTIALTTQAELALEEYSKALALDPTHYWSHYQRGRCLLSLGKYAEAIEVLGTCVALRDNVPWAYTSRGLAYALQNDFVSARRDLDQALAIHPDHPAALLNRGVVYRLMGSEQYDKAISDLNRLFQLPEKRLIAEAAFARAQVYLSKGDYANALLDLDLAMEHQPAFQPGRALRAQLQLLRGNTESGLQDITYLLKMEDDGLDIPNQPESNPDRQSVLATKRYERGRFLRHLAQEGGVRQSRLAELAKRDLEYLHRDS
jgi:tetratricopeptide (TPR) repeat protein